MRLIIKCPQAASVERKQLVFRTKWWTLRLKLFFSYQVGIKINLRASRWIYREGTFTYLHKLLDTPDRYEKENTFLTSNLEFC